MTFKWYVIDVYSGSENRVAQTIQEQAQKKGLADKIEDIFVPSEEVMEVRRGVKVKTQRRFFPGYILINMELTDETWHLVRSVPKVSKLLGKGQPLPISEKEVQQIMSQVQERKDKPTISLSFEIGENVKVSEGPFASFNGIVEEVDQEKARLKVSVSIFGRATPVDLEFTQVEKI